MARVGVEQEQILSTAEQAAALVLVLKAARVLGDELETMLRIAARGLRVALSPESLAAFTPRIRALDRRLDSGGGD